MHISKSLLLGLGLAGFIMESVVIQPALAADKVSLFKVITAKDEIVIGIADDELAQLDGKNAGGIAKMLVAKGSMSVWQYTAHKSASGDLEQAPLHRIGLHRHRLASRRTLCDAAEGAADRRDEKISDNSPFDGARTRGPGYALLRAAGRFWGRRPRFGESAMSLGTILIIIVIIFLLGGFSGRFGGYGYGMGHSGMGLGGVILVVLLVLILLGKL